MSKNRLAPVKINLGTFDLAKGIVMIGIVLAHMTNYYDLTQVPLLKPLVFYLRVTAFGANPMFFLISGYAFRPKPVAKHLKQTASDLLVPYLWVMVLITVLFPVVHFLSFHWWPGAIYEGIRYTLAFLFGIPGGKETVIFGYPVYECSVVYFLLTMFLSLNFTNLITKLKNPWIRWVCVALCVVLADVLFRAGFTYYCLPQGLLMTVYCYVGYQMKQHDLMEKVRKHRWIYLILLAISVPEVIYGTFGLAYGVFSCIYLDVIGAGAIALLMFFIGVAIGDNEWRGLDWLRRVGVYTYWIMCIHSVEMTCIPWYHWNEILSSHLYLAYILEVCMKAVIITAGCIILRKIAKLKYRRKLNHAR